MDVIVETPPDIKFIEATESFFDGIYVLKQDAAAQVFPNLFQESNPVIPARELPENFHWYSGAEEVLENSENVHSFDPVKEAELGKKIIDGAKRSFRSVYLYERNDGTISVVVDTRTKIDQEEK